MVNGNASLKMATVDRQIMCKSCYKRTDSHYFEFLKLLNAMNCFVSWAAKVAYPVLHKTLYKAVKGEGFIPC